MWHAPLPSSHSRQSFCSRRQRQRGKDKSLLSKSFTRTILTLKDNVSMGVLCAIFPDFCIYESLNCIVSMCIEVDWCAVRFFLFFYQGFVRIVKVIHWIQRFFSKLEIWIICLTKSAFYEKQWFLWRINENLMRITLKKVNLDFRLYRWIQYLENMKIWFDMKIL